MKEEIQKFIDQLDSETDKMICSQLDKIINAHLNFTENKIWHRQPVWFIEGNPIVGFIKQKPGIRLMFWSGADFEEEKLTIRGGKFKDASVFYNAVEELNKDEIINWLKKAEEIQWDYKNLIQRKGKLEKIKGIK